VPLEQSSQETLTVAVHLPGRVKNTVHYMCGGGGVRLDIVMMMVAS
jgi:hypothetical protein